MAGAFALALSACEQKPSASVAAPRADTSSAPAPQADARQPQHAGPLQPPAVSALVAQARAQPEPNAPSSAPAPDKPESKPSLPKSPTGAGKPASAGRPVGDTELAARVKSAVLAEPLTALLFNVNVSNGVVTLSGTADTAATRDKAARAASAVEGVRSVNNQIAVLSGS
jgi:hypothetical protein